MATIAPTSDPHSTSSITALYTSIGRAYEDAFGNVPGQIRAAEWILSSRAELLATSSSSSPPSPNRPLRVVDIGCGTGKPICTILASAGAAAVEIHGIDATPAMIDAARAQVPSGTFAVADARTWEPESGDGSFDAVTSFFALLTGLTPAEIRAFFPNAARWLRPGGLLVFGTIESPALEDVAMRWMGREILVTNLEKGEFERVIEAAGFVVERVEAEKFSPRGAEAGLCRPEDEWEEAHLFFFCRKKL